MFLFFFLFSLGMRESETVNVVNMYETGKKGGGRKPQTQKEPPCKFYTAVNSDCSTHPFTLYQTEKLQMMHLEIMGRANSSDLFAGFICVT